MSAPKVIGLVLGGVMAFFVVTEPAAAAAIVTSVFGALGDGAEAIIVFLQNLFS